MGVVFSGDGIQISISTHETKPQNGKRALFLIGHFECVLPARFSSPSRQAGISGLSFRAFRHLYSSKFDVISRTPLLFLAAALFFGYISAARGMFL
jgi:hypothetical protein